MRIVLICLAWLFTMTVYAQKFSNDKEKFVKELTKTIPQESFHKYLKKEFLPFLLKNGLGSFEFERLTKQCNYLFDGDFTYQEIVDIVHITRDQKKKIFTKSFVEKWQDLYSECISEGDVQKTVQFIFFSKNLFSENSFFNGDNHKWVFNTGTPKWEFTKKTNRIRLTNTDLKCLVYQSGPVDSIVIEKTSGYFDLSKNRWYGRGGLITWEKVNFPREETFAKIRGYNINTKESVLKVDTVALTTPYFKEPVLGRLKDKTLFNLKVGESSPIFNSFEKRLKIEGLKDQLNYVGGFSLQGFDFIGIGEPGKLAKVVLLYDNKPLFEIRSLRFLMNPKQIIARDADVSMYYANGDSLYTSKGLFYWDEEKKELRVTANKMGSNLLPFSDSFFKLFIKAPLLSWTLNSPFPMFTYEVGTAQEQKYAFIESWDYFNQGVFQKYAGIGSVNPLMEIANLSIEEETMVLPVGKVASALRKTISQCKSQLIDISSAGFIQYRSTDNEVIVEQKLLNFALSSLGQKDYDELSMVCDLRPKVLKASKAQIDNSPYLKNKERKFQEVTRRRTLQPCYAYIDINSKEILLNEVESVRLSTKQKTSFYPDSSYVRISANRDMKISGWLESGKFLTHSIESTFDYNSFSVQFDSTDQAYLSVDPLDPIDGKKRIDMVSSFSAFQGTLFIDDSLIRSGRNAYNSEYPFLDVKNNLRVLYSANDIVNGAYDSTRFYYVLDPFVLDSLDDFDEKELSLEGKLVSDGIFPELMEPLRIMNDYSFGFSTEAPESGYPFYETESVYKNKIVLSNNGLQGAGTINFLQASATSKKLTFLPDSTVGLASFYSNEIQTGIEYPEAKCELASMSFKPRLKILSIKSYRDSYIGMFKDECSLDGSISISEQGMVGNGRIDLMDALLISSEFSFKSKDIFSDSADFTMRNKFAKQEENPMAIQSEGLKTHISFEDRLGVFNSSGSKRIKFPSNNFYCQMDKFIWQMDGEQIDFEKDKGTETNFESSAGIVENNFFSLDEKQDSLQFKSISAQYDLKNETINCFKVDFLELGDAYIYPKRKEINILKDAVIDTLFNAGIVANRITGLHQFADVTLQVLGRNEFNGFGNYLYYDRDSLSTKLAVASISFDRIQTIASAKIPEEINFKLSSKFGYYGTMDIASKNSGVICNGYTRINHSCSFDRSWLLFEDTIIANDVRIPVTEEPQNKQGERLAIGFLWRDSENPDSIQVYPAFLSSIDNPTDSYLFNSSGKVFYDYENGSFEISNNRERITNIYAKNSIILKDESCRIKGVGKIDLGINLDPVSVVSYGSIAYDVNKKKIRLDLTTKLNIPLPKSVLSELGRNISQSDSLSEYTFDRKTQDYLTDIFALFGEGREKGERVFKEYDEDKLKKAPSFLNATFLIPDLRLETIYLPKNGDGNSVSGLKSRNSKISLFSMSDQIVLKKISGQILFMRKTAENTYPGFEMILDDKLMKREYWMKYDRVKRNGVLNIFTNDQGVNDAIVSIKPDKRKSKNFGFTILDEGEMFQLMMLKR
ncbi:MAG: hypothetical protein QNK70_06160 [Crocinitomicaceae bacterium]|mgnify:CR=1 FL=1|tara:strand:+ start:4187 stop:8767 length:4581 start_codon:yes stop_codon:yes gene_type:complete